MSYHRIEINLVITQNFGMNALTHEPEYEYRERSVVKFEVIERDG
jgi:hypothetical protein